MPLAGYLTRFRRGHGHHADAPIGGRSSQQLVAQKDRSLIQASYESLIRPLAA